MSIWSNQFVTVDCYVQKALTFELLKHLPYGAAVGVNHAFVLLDFKDDLLQVIGELALGQAGDLICHGDRLRDWRVALGGAGWRVSNHKTLTGRQSIDNH